MKSDGVSIPEICKLVASQSGAITNPWNVRKDLELYTNNPRN